MGANGESAPESTTTDSGLPSIKTLRQGRDHEEAQVILSVLNSTKWNRKQAARMLDMDYKALLYRMKRLGIDSASDEPPLRQAVSGD
jgi:transcriptional regulator with GAF, ATPase, and Fis domain